MPSGTTRRLLTTADHHWMIETGNLRPQDRVELLAGEIYEAASVSSPHAACVMRLTLWFSARVVDRLRAGEGLAPLALPDLDLSVSFLLG